MVDFGGIEILLVEDNPQDVEMMSRALNKCNFINRVFWVKDGVEALDFIHCTGAYACRSTEECPTLILLDLKMPRLSGIDVLRELESGERTIGMYWLSANEAPAR